MTTNRIITTVICILVVFLGVFAIQAGELTTAHQTHTICAIPTNSTGDLTFSSYFTELLATNNWPARWTCGDWSAVEGWLYISADLSIFLAYLSIPIILLWYVKNRFTKKTRRLIALFAAFILLCGFTHLIDVVLFWEPVYRLSGFVKLLTGAVSIVTAITLGFVIPKALKYKSPRELQSEINERTKIQSQLETFVKYSPGATAMLDSELRYMMANPGWYEAYGIKGVEIIGKSHLDIFPLLKEMPEWLERYDKALAGERLSSDFDFYEFDGHTLYFRWKLEPWRNPDDSVGGIIIFTEIITEQVKIEKKLNESELRFTNIFNRAQVAVALVDDKGIPFLVNDRFSELLGYSKEELTSLSFEDFTHPDDADHDRKWYRELMNHESDGFTLEKRFITKNGKIKYVSLNIALIDVGIGEEYGLVLIEDLTDAKLANRKNEALNKMMVDVSSIAHIGSFELDVMTGECHWSETVIRIHEEDSGKEISLEDAINYYHPDHREIITKAVEEGIANREPWDLELKIITAKGNEKWTRSVGKAIEENGEVIKLQGLFQDIDEKKRYELEIENAKKGLESEVEQRTEALTKANEELEAFSYSVSHDLRAPLRAINGYSEALIEDYQEEIPEEANQYLTRITKNSVKMGALIDDLLQFSRMNRKKVNYGTVQLSSLVNSLIDDLFSHVSKNIIVAELPEVIGDKAMLYEVFQNIISNAVKYSSKEENPKIYINSEESDTSYVISIQDNGVGFDMEYYHKLFNVFQRLHSESEFEGTGVGLSLSAKIMKAHDGEIWAEGKKGEGATFYLRFKKI